MAESPLTRQGILALQNRDRNAAARLFAEAVRQEPDDEAAWLGLGFCLDDASRKRFCLKKVLALNPNNPDALNMLARLDAPPAPAPVPPPAPAPTPPPPPPAPAARTAPLKPRPPEPPPPEPAYWETAAKAEVQPPADDLSSLRDAAAIRSNTAVTDALRPSESQVEARPARRRSILLPLMLGLLGIFLLIALAAGAWLVLGGSLDLQQILQAIQPPAPAAPASPAQSTPQGVPASTPVSTPVSTGPGLTEIRSFGAGRILDTALSPNSNRLVVATTQGLALFDLSGWTPDTLPSLIKKIPTNQPVTSLAVSSDGHRVAGILRQGAGPQSLLVWNLDDNNPPVALDTSVQTDSTGATLYDPLNNPVVSLAFSPDGRQLVGSGTRLAFWDYENGRFIKSGPDGRTNLSLVFTPDGKAFATCEQDQVILWDSLSFEQVQSLATSLSPLNSGCNQLAYSPDGSLLAFANANDSVDVWQMPAGLLHFNLVPPVEHNPQGPVTSLVAFSPDNAFLLVGRGSQVFKWNLADGNLAATLDLPQPVTRILFTPDGKMFLTFSAPDGRVRLWQPSDLSLVSELPAFDDFSRSVLSPDGASLAVPLAEGGVRVLNTGDGKAVISISKELDLQPLGFSPENLSLAILGRKLEFYQVKDGALEHAVDVSGKHLALDPAWRAFLTYDGAELKAYNAADGVSSWSKSFSSPIEAAAYSRGGKAILVLAEGLHVLQAGDGNELYRLEGATSLQQVAWSPDDQWVAYSAGHAAVIARSGDGASASSTNLTQEEMSLSFSPDSRYLVVSDRDNLKVINTVTGVQEYGKTDCSLAHFSPDASRLACYDSKNARLRLVALYYKDGKIEVGSDYTNITPLHEVIKDLVFLPSGRQLLTTSADGVARLWQTP